MKADREPDTYRGKSYSVNHPVFLFYKHIASDSIYFSIPITMKIARIVHF